MAETTVLIIDDDEAIHREIDAILEHFVDRTLHSRRPDEGILMAITHRPDVILLDINMPGMDGLKVCRHFKESEELRETPVLFLTIDHSVRQIAKALDVGGADYIMKPFNGVELRARVRVALRTKRMFDMLKEQARVDALTGLKNRAALDDALIAALAAYQRLGEPMSILMLDLDNFKEINDRHGHGVGDQVLQRVGAVVGARHRPYDVACRFGGDEFAVVYARSELCDAERAARRLLSEIGEIAVVAGAHRVTTTASGGLVSITEMPGGAEPADVLKAADAALYRAKCGGRDRLEVGLDADGGG
jgi:two-component system cell cycle response regulator